MCPIDQRERLKSLPFSHRVTREGSVMIAYEGRQVKTLSGTTAARFIARIQGAGEIDAQLQMAKVTGNFKHGNERR